MSGPDEALWRELWDHNALIVTEGYVGLFPVYTGRDRRRLPAGWIQSERARRLATQKRIKPIKSGWVAVRPKPR